VVTSERTGPDPPVDVLVVGAGPTGLALAAELAASGVRPRLVDRGRGRAEQSRALAIQPRTLEVLAGLGVGQRLVEAGNPAVRLRMHAGGREVSMPMFDLGLDDTAYPYLLFLSQAETERMLEEHLAAAGVPVEREVELTDLDLRPEAAVAVLRHHGREETVPARYLVGCDGAGSAVRRLSGIPFQGGSYPQTFVLADLEADGVQPGSAHVHLSRAGMLFFFPLVHPASWRMLVIRPPGDPTPPDAPVTLPEVQAIADAYTGGRVRLRDPVWMTNFRLHHRAAAHYRTGPVFLAGDAAHIHSPAGAQGMNTGIQDAANLGWKLAQTLRGAADPALLDTYEPERAPVGRAVLRFTDRAFTVATSTNPVVRLARTRLAPALVPLAARAGLARAYGFRTVAQLRIRYRRSPLSATGPGAPRRGPRPGDRMPDADLTRDGQPTTLHTAFAGRRWQLLLCGPVHSWPTAEVAGVREGHRGLVTVHQLCSDPVPGALHDPAGRMLRRLGVTGRDTAQYLLRPDGHIGYRAGGTSLAGLTGYLRRWLR
jgi:2-polyprenyl-6-methoxyphenol hydroxylase-like FAD-dependent oxidoreductase